MLNLALLVFCLAGAGMIPAIEITTEKLNEAEQKELKEGEPARRLELFHQCYDLLQEQLVLASEKGIVIHCKQGAEPL